MTAEAIHHPGPPGLPFSSAVRAGGLLMLSGQIPFDPTGKPHRGTAQEQTHAVMRSISRTLESLGSSLDDVVKVTVWLSDLADFADFNAAYRTYFQEGRFPARSLVQAKLAFDVGVEIEAQAIDRAA